MPHDELCIICGINPSAGPLWILSLSDLDQVAHDIASEIKEGRNAEDYSKIQGIVRDALASSCSADAFRLDYVAKWKPDGMADWFAFRRCVAIGHFDGDLGGAKVLKDAQTGSVTVPSGRGVEVRRVFYYMSDRFDHKLLDLEEDEYGELWDMEEEAMSRITVYEGNPNFFTSEGCYHYLQAWLDLNTMPPRARAFPTDDTPLTFGGEFYEVVNSRRAVRGKPSTFLTRTINADPH
jgi:hypothetical protein